MTYSLAGRRARSPPMKVSNIGTTMVAGVTKAVGSWSSQALAR